MTHITLYIYFMTKAIFAISVWFRVYVLKHMFYMTVFCIYGSMEKIKNEY